MGRKQKLQINTCLIVDFYIAGFLLISLLAFIGEFVCGHYFGRKYKESSNDTSPPAAPVPLYEDVNDLEL